MPTHVKRCEDESTTFTGWASTGTAELKKWSYHPRPLGPNDIEVEISHCGICGSDIHTITAAWGELKGPCIVGHEVVGKVAAKGDKSTHQIGDIVGVGGLVGSCGQCKECKKGFEQLCPAKTFIFRDHYKDGRGGETYGGFADRLRVDGHYAFKIPPEIPPAEAAPLLCAGLTMYAPLKAHGAGPGKTVGVIGIGGLGHLGLQWARAMQCDEVVAISSSDSKREEAFKLGATKFVNSKNPEDMKGAARSMDIILCSSFEKNADWGELLNLVANHGTMVLLAFPEGPLSIPGSAFINRQVTMAGSMIGGVETTREMIAFAAKHNVRPWIEKMPMSDANAAVKHAMEGRPRFRVVMEA